MTAAARDIRAFSHSSIELARVTCGFSFFIRHSRQRHPVVAWSGTGSACGRSEHQQECPGSQDMAALHCEQTVFMVDSQFSLWRRIVFKPRGFYETANDTTYPTALRSRGQSRSGKAHSRSLGFPRFPVKNCSFGGFHAALFTESRIRCRW